MQLLRRGITRELDAAGGFAPPSVIAITELQLTFFALHYGVRFTSERDDSQFDR